MQWKIARRRACGKLHQPNFNRRNPVQSWTDFACACVGTGVVTGTNRIGSPGNLAITVSAWAWQRGNLLERGHRDELRRPANDA